MTLLQSAFADQARLPTGVRAWMSTRAGGCSAAPFDSLNLGAHVGDDPLSVQGNRALLTDAIQAQAVFMQQVHGTAVVELKASPADAPVADACWSQVPGVACTIMVADCLPVLMWDIHARWVAAAHAGWRGMAGKEGMGVLESLWHVLRQQGARARETRIWLGPCIGPSAFEVGPEVVAAFDGSGQTMAEAFRSGVGDRSWADLAGIARWRLKALGLTDIGGNDGSADYCTVAQSGLFFSHRRDAVRLGSTGRMVACIWLDGQGTAQRR